MSHHIEIMPRGTRSIPPASYDGVSVSSSATVTSPPRKGKFVSRLWQRVTHSSKTDDNQSSRPPPAHPRYPSFASSFEWVPDSAWFLPGRSTESLTPTEHAALNEWLDYKPSPTPQFECDAHNGSPTVHKTLPAMPGTKNWIGVYLILYNITTTLLWSYLLVLVIYHLFLAPTTRPAPLNPFPQAASYPTASSFIRSHLRNIFSLSTPSPASPVSKTAAGVTSALEGILSALVEKARTTYSSRGIGVYTAFVQSAAILEVVHALFRWTKSPLVTTIMQVASRLIVVWWIGEGYEPVCRQCSTLRGLLADALHIPGSKFTLLRLYADRLVLRGDNTKRLLYLLPCWPYHAISLLLPLDRRIRPPSIHPRRHLVAVHCFLRLIPSWCWIRICFNPHLLSVIPF